MSQTVTLGGDRLGSGHKQTVELHNYEMTSFNLEQDFKSSMAPGILYPFLKAVATNHGTFDIDLDSFVRTLPTQGPLFGSFKLQLDIFAVPFRLYQGLLHNNPVTLGMKMNQVYLPKIRFKTIDWKSAPRVVGSTDDNFQVNESALEKYLGLSGYGRNSAQNSSGYAERKLQCLPELAYYDIFKNYYANKQEENAYIITPGTPTVARPEVKEVKYTWKTAAFPYAVFTETGEAEPDRNYIFSRKKSDNSTFVSGEIVGKNFQTKYLKVYAVLDNSGTERTTEIENPSTWFYFTVVNNKIYLKISEDNWSDMQDEYAEEGESLVAVRIDIQYTSDYYQADIALTPFKLSNIDDMRNALLSANTIGKEFVLGNELTDDWTSTSGSDETGLPYSALFNQTTQGITWNAFAQNGLVVKTYQSDLFNNWLDTEYIDGENGISAISSVAVVSNKFSMDSLNLAEKIYEYLNRVLVSGGTYEDWQEATYGQGAVRKAETPMYIGGMSAEVMFEEVIATTEMTSADQALGSLGGKGTQVGKNGGNNIHVKCDEPSYILGIVSLTPRICYSQGNDWDRTELDTMDDLHKPALDGIGFQDLIVEQMAWWNTILNGGAVIHRSSAGKQIAWINYQTAVDKCYGDFAKQDGYAFMVLNRNYEHGDTVGSVKDITTYIDPAKFNYAFAYSELDAQNFWVQIHSKVVARRKMAGKQIPNL